MNSGNEHFYRPLWREEAQQLHLANLSLENTELRTKAATAKQFIEELFKLIDDYTGGDGCNCEYGAGGYIDYVCIRCRMYQMMRELAEALNIPDYKDIRP